MISFHVVTREYQLKKDHRRHGPLTVCFAKFSVKRNGWSPPQSATSNFKKFQLKAGAPTFFFLSFFVF